MSKKNKVIVCGGRGFKCKKTLEQAIKKSGFKIDEIVHGGAPGADSLAGEWAEKNSIPVKVFPALWDDLTVANCKVKTNNWGKEYNVMAGFNRNKAMAEYATHCIAVEGGNGTNDMIERATEAKLEVYVHGEVKSDECKYQF